MESTRQRTKVSDIAPTTLRLHPDVRDLLMREARISNRSLSQEIAYRLQRSLLADDPPAATTGQGVAEPAGVYLQPVLPDEQRALLALFKALSPERQLALLTLLRA